ncbi:MAG: glutamine-hydrolyzing GMP synthase [Candidatus Cloacimonetes bacterium]|nr:glutamine-hydrolyzing GMP synthase [Candidatus Cloacimonadota bacterium]
MTNHELVLILDFGSQYTQLIAKKIRKLKIYCEIVPFNISFEEVVAKSPKAIVLSGSPFSVNMPSSPIPDQRILEMNLPILAICYGMQLITSVFGGKVVRAEKKEYGHTRIEIIDHSSIFHNLGKFEEVWMSHGDAVAELSEEFHRIAFSENSPYAAIAHQDKPIIALQFHPEVVHTVGGEKMLENFLIRIAHFSKDWTASSFIESSINEIRQMVGQQKVILGLSGGVDSSVTAALLYKAIGKNLIPILVDTGLLRKNEAAEVDKAFKSAFNMELITVNAEDIFLEKLGGIADPEQKRKIIGNTFIEIFEKEALKHPEAAFLAQGTLYPDVIESVSFKGPSATIKSHHNVGGLPEKMNLKLVEPLRELFKDEVREVGRNLGLPAKLVDRHPFPGPGLAIRIISDVSREKVRLLQDIDTIFIEELHKHGLYKTTWQAFAVLLPIQSVGVMGDERTYENVCALRAVNSVDGMTADWTELPYWFLKRVSNRLINEVNGINRVVYDISSKPPATIEWE